MNNLYEFNCNTNLLYILCDVTIGIPIQEAASSDIFFKNSGLIISNRY